MCSETIKAFEIGMRLDNRYEIVEKLDTSGMGVIYKARDLKFPTCRVAVKVSSGGEMFHQMPISFYIMADIFDDPYHRLRFVRAEISKRKRELVQREHNRSICRLCGRSWYSHYGWHSFLHHLFAESRSDFVDKTDLELSFEVYVLKKYESDLEKQLNYLIQAEIKDALSFNSHLSTKLRVRYAFQQYLHSPWSYWDQIFYYQDRGESFLDKIIAASTEVTGLAGNSVKKLRGAYRILSRSMQTPPLSFTVVESNLSPIVYIDYLLALSHACCSPLARRFDPSWCDLKSKLINGWGAVTTGFTRGKKSVGRMLKSLFTWCDTNGFWKDKECTPPGTAFIVPHPRVFHRLAPPGVREIGLAHAT